VGDNAHDTGAIAALDANIYYRTFAVTNLL
jgi:hypothetical protein